MAHIVRSVVFICSLMAFLSFASTNDPTEKKCKKLLNVVEVSNYPKYFSLPAGPDDLLYKLSEEAAIRAGEIAAHLLPLRDIAPDLIGETYDRSLYLSLWSLFSAYENTWAAQSYANLQELEQVEANLSNIWTAIAQKPLSTQDLWFPERELHADLYTGSENRGSAGNYFMTQFRLLFDQIVSRAFDGSTEAREFFEDPHFQNLIYEFRLSLFPDDTSFDYFSLIFNEAAGPHPLAHKLRLSRASNDVDGGIDSVNDPALADFLSQSPLLRAYQQLLETHDHDYQFVLGELLRDGYLNPEGTHHTELVKIFEDILTRGDLIEANRMIVNFRLHKVLIEPDVRERIVQGIDSIFLSMAQGDIAWAIEQRDFQRFIKSTDTSERRQQAASLLKTLNENESRSTHQTKSEMTSFPHPRGGMDIVDYMIVEMADTCQVLESALNKEQYREKLIKFRQIAEQKKVPESVEFFNRLLL